MEDVVGRIKKNFIPLGQGIFSPSCGGPVFLLCHGPDFQLCHGPIFRLHRQRRCNGPMPRDSPLIKKLLLNLRFTA
jgi:hypothetical protein